MTAKAKLVSVQLPPQKYQRNPVALAVYEHVFTTGKTRVNMAKDLFLELDKLMNRMLRRGIASGILREQKRMLDALANDTLSIVENTDPKGHKEVVSVTVTYKIEAWKAIGNMIDQFAEQEELAELEKSMQQADKEKSPDGKTPIGITKSKLVTPPVGIIDIARNMATRIATIKDQELKNLLSRHELWRDDLTTEQLGLDLSEKGYAVGEVKESNESNQTTKYTYTLFKVVDKSSFSISTTYHLDVIEDNKEKTDE